MSGAPAIPPVYQSRHFMRPAIEFEAGPHDTTLGPPAASTCARTLRIANLQEHNTGNSCKQGSQCTFFHLLYQLAPSAQFSRLSSRLDMEVTGVSAFHFMLDSCTVNRK